MIHQIVVSLDPLRLVEPEITSNRPRVRRFDESSKGTLESQKSDLLLDWTEVVESADDISRTDVSFRKGGLEGQAFRDNDIEEVVSQATLLRRKVAPPMIPSVEVGLTLFLENESFGQG